MPNVRHHCPLTIDELASSDAQFCLPSIITACGLNAHRTTKYSAATRRPQLRLPSTLARGGLIAQRATKYGAAMSDAITSAYISSMLEISAPTRSMPASTERENSGLLPPDASLTAWISAPLATAPTTMLATMNAASSAACAAGGPPAVGTTAASIRSGTVVSAITSIGAKLPR